VYGGFLVQGLRLDCYLVEKKQHWHCYGGDKMKKITVEFETGYETEVKIDIKANEYWVDITERQNPYDAADQPISIVVDGEHISLDEDGDWLITLEKNLKGE
jgi:hypothetical protein